MGIYIDDFAALGHVRLSIIDLSGGNQPIHNENKTIWITYNGEIFNYPELRHELELKGHSFSTKTDTEILIHLYEEEGTGFLNKLNGQWAFALWDNSEKKLLLSRDRLGIRPLYYTWHAGTFLFASEIKSLFTISGVKRKIDPVAIDQIFTLWTTLPGKTVFTGVQELEPGHCMVVDENRVQVSKYWEIPLGHPEQWLTDTPDSIAEQLRDLLIDAVRIRLRADVPVGTYLSGGLDSSGVTAIAAKKFHPDIQTFGIRFDERRFDEGVHQHEMVKFLGVKHRELQITDEEIGASFLSTVASCEKPLLRTAPVPLRALSQMVRDSGIKVVLSGEGADEFNAGYDIFKEAVIRNFWSRNVSSTFRGKLIGRLYPDIFQDERAIRLTEAFFKRDITGTDDPLYSHLIRWKNTSRLKMFFSDELVSTVSDYDCLDECRQRLPAGFMKMPILEKAQFLEAWIFLSNYLLSSQGDRVGMAHSVELRMPYLDYRLIELCGKVPSWMKLCGLHEKHILKKALGPFLPASITSRVKHPYRAPVHKSLIAFLNTDCGYDLMSNDAISDTGLFAERRVQALLSKLRTAGQASETESMALAGIISTQYLHRIFLRSSCNQNYSCPLNVFIDKRSR